MAETERVLTDEAKRLLVRFKSDLVTLTLTEPFNASVDVVLVGLVQVTEALLRRAVRAEPASLPAVLQAIDGVRANIIRVAQPPAEAPVETWN